MCCKSKTKPTTTTTQINGGVPVYTTTTAIGNSKTPKSTINFTANDFESSPLTNQQNFLITKKVVQNNEDRSDRLEDYAHQTNAAKESKLLVPKQLLTYDLDNRDGVSKTPVVNTFHYESQLNHCFLKQYNADQINSRNSVYQNQPATNSVYIADPSLPRTSYVNQQSNLQGSFQPTNSKLNKSGESSFFRQERNSGFILDDRQDGVYQNSNSNPYAIA